MRQPNAAFVHYELQVAIAQRKTQIPTNAQDHNPAAFVTPADGTWGNAGRNLVRAPGIWQADVSLGKKLALTERASLEFQAAAFNLFNRAQLGSPNGDISSPTFGRITNTINPRATGTGTPRQFQFMLRLSY